MSEDVERESSAKLEGGISLILPCYNEAGNIQAIIEEAKAVLEKISREYEIIVVDDGSNDESPEIVEKLSLTNPNLLLIKHPFNLGYGSALRSGFGKARLRWIFFTDADRQFKIGELERFIPYLEKTKMVVGYRARRADRIHRKIYGAIFSRLINFLFGLRIKDVNCAFKIFAREIIEGKKLISPGALINAELFILAKNQGVKPIQLPVSHFPRKVGKQSGGSFKVILRAFWELARLYWLSK